jgi:hypothetical protein
MDSGGTVMNEEMDKLPIRGRVLGDAGDAMDEAETGQIVVEIVMVGVMGAARTFRLQRDQNFW